MLINCKSKYVNDQELKKPIHLKIEQHVIDCFTLKGKQKNSHMNVTEGLASSSARYAPILFPTQPIEGYPWGLT